MSEPVAWDDDDSRAIVARIQRGEPELAAVLYERYFDTLYGFLCSFLGDHASAEDVTHQVFEAMLEGLPEYQHRAEASFRSWLFAIARNSAADHRRKHGRVDVTPPLDMSQRIDHVSSTDQAELRISWLSDADVMAALRRLPTFQREIVLLRYVADFELAEIARVLGVSEDSVKQGHRRALRALRDRLSIVAGGGTTRRRPLSMCELSRDGSHLSGHGFSPMQSS